MTTYRKKVTGADKKKQSEPSAELLELQSLLDIAPVEMEEVLVKLHVTGRKRLKVYKSKKLPSPTPNEWDIVKMASMGVSIKSIAIFYDVTEEFINREFEAAIRKGTNNLNMKLEIAQVSEALSGSAGLLVHLGKLKLGQAEETTINQNVNLEPTALKDIPSEAILSALSSWKEECDNEEPNNN